MSSQAEPHVIGIIPARWGSTRFPGKPLHILAGKPLVQHVWERVRQCQELRAVAIATDDERIRRAAEDFGAQVVMTSPEHPSGSDRIAEAVQAFPGTTHVVNIQGDEPLIDPELIDSLARVLVEDESLSMATAAAPITNEQEFHDPNVVKVVLNTEGNALYFSRSPIPFPRHEAQRPALRHLGIYAYKLAFLKQYVSWPPSPLEQTESLEQLRALEHGASIRVILTQHQGIGLDTPDQIPLIEQLILNTSQSTPS